MGAKVTKTGRTGPAGAGSMRENLPANISPTVATYCALSMFSAQTSKN